MSDDGIVLGWALADHLGARGVKRRNIGRLDVLLAAPHAASTSRMRLALQLSYLKAGLSFVPLAPSMQLNAKQGALLAEKNALSLTKSLARLEDKGQLTLQMTWKADPPPIGKSWLRTRRQSQKAQHKAKEHARELLKAFDFSPWESAFRCTSTSCTRDILIAPADVRPLLRLVRLTANQPTTRDFNLTCSGLWPAFSFTPDIGALAA